MEDDQPLNAAEEPAVVSDEPDYKELWQRALADLENARKRFDVERLSTIKFGQQGLIEELLPVIDNFYRATDHVPEDQKTSPWVMGVQYIQKNLLDVLQNYGVSEFAVAVGDAFDATRQEAIGTAQNEAIAEDHVAEVVGRGYMIHDRILRPARVIVSKGNK